MNYARLEDFDNIIHHLAHDETSGQLELTTAQVLATMSVLLAAYANMDMPATTRELMLDIAKLYSADLIERYPFAEGYVDFLFGAALMGRTGFWK